MSRAARPRLAILGAGPMGLEAGLCASHFKLPFTIYERGEVGQHLRQWGHVRLFTPFGMTTTPLGCSALRTEHPHQDWPGEHDLLTGRELLSRYLEPLARLPQLANQLQTRTEVLQVARRGYLRTDPLDASRRKQPFLLLVRDAEQRERIDEAEIILDCTGVYSRPRWVGEGGIPARGEQTARAHFAHGVEDVLGERRAHYAGKTILVVGAGYSAATTVCNLATLAETEQGTWVIWVARGPGSQPIRRFASDPLRERDRLAMRANMLATRPEGNVEFHPATVIEALLGPHQDSFEVQARCAGRPRKWQVERIIANVGYRPETTLTEELLPDEPDYHVLGAKSTGENSLFLLHRGFEQMRTLFEKISKRSV